MKRVFCHILMILCILSLFAGLFTAYAEMGKENSSTRGGDYENPVYYSFWVSMDYGGDVDLATPREKIFSSSYASYTLTSVTNTTGWKFYINVRNQYGSAIAGNAHTVSVGASTPLSFVVSYLSGYGTVGNYYRPSGMSYSNSIAGVVTVCGEWLP